MRCEPWLQLDGSYVAVGWGLLYMIFYAFSLVHLLMRPRRLSCGVLLFVVLPLPGVSFAGGVDGVLPVVWSFFYVGVDVFRD